MGNRRSLSFKMNAVEKALKRGDQTMEQIAHQHGIGNSTLSRWMYLVKKGQLGEKSVLSLKEKRPQDLTASEKFQTIVDTTGLSETELGRYCRKNGLFPHVRGQNEFEAMHIKGAMHVPRGILESACEWDYEETVPKLVRARDRHMVVVCRSGYRSLMAAYSLHLLGFKDVCSLKTGLRGWKDYDQPMVDKDGYDVDLDYADDYFTAKLRPDQMKPESWVDPG